MHPIPVVLSCRFTWWFQVKNASTLHTCCDGFHCKGDGAFKRCEPIAPPSTEAPTTAAPTASPTAPIAPVAIGLSPQEAAAPLAVPQTQPVQTWDLVYQWPSAPLCTNGLGRFVSDQVTLRWEELLFSQKVSFNMTIRTTCETKDGSASAVSASSTASPREITSNATSSLDIPVTRISLGIPHDSLSMTNFQNSTICWALCQPQRVRPIDRIFPEESTVILRVGAEKVHFH